MNKAGKIVVVVALIVIVGIVIAIKQREGNSPSEPVAAANSNPDTATDSTTQSSEILKSTDTTVNLPRLVDLGADKCIPCKMMAPILEELKTEYEGRLEVEFIDVWKNPGAGREYDIRVIPTQIFYDEKGKELFRHEGFFSKEDILGKWKEFGVELVKEK